MLIIMDFGFTSKWDVNYVNNLKTNEKKQKILMVFRIKYLDKEVKCKSVISYFIN